MRQIPLVSDLTCCISLPDNFVFRLEESAHLSAADFLFIENLDWPLANAICYCHYASFLPASKWLELILHLFYVDGVLS